MSNLPDFTQHGYKVQRVLGKNTLGGRITYQATDLTTQQNVVIKQFQFTGNYNSWSDYQGIEIVNHPFGIGIGNDGNLTVRNLTI